MSRPARSGPVNAALRAAFYCALSAALFGCQPPAPADPAAAAAGKGAPRSIGAIQGQGARSPYEGDTVSVQGVITGNFVKGLGGFFMQDASGAQDGNPATSDAIFVEYPAQRNTRLRRGDRVSVLGQVKEIGDGGNTLTALVSAEVEVLGRGAVSTTTINAAPLGPLGWEALEGMWLRIQAPLTISSTHNLLRFGELQLAFGEALWAPTEWHAPGPKARALAEANRARTLLVDDARSSQNPSKLWYLPEALTAATPLRAGSTVSQLEGVLDQRYGQWRLQLTAALDAVQQAPRPLPPELPPGLRIGSFNVHNLFNGNGRGGGFPTEHGARSQAEYVRQRDKVVAMISALQPDIAALSEVENDGFEPSSALSDLLRALNNQLGEQGDYQAVVGGEAGSDPIRVAIIYRSSKVQTVGAAASLLDAPFQHGRPPLAQTFAVGSEPRRLTLVAVHFKSKGGCPSDASAASNRDQGDGQGCWNAERVEQARSLDRWIKTDPTASGSPHQLLIGDFNSYSQEDPLRLLHSQGWRESPGKREQRHYSYRYGGELGNLDHALFSPSLAPAWLGAAAWAINSDENEAFDYHREQHPPDPFAASDHNPLLLVIDPQRAAQGGP